MATLNFGRRNSEEESSVVDDEGMTQQLTGEDHNRKTMPIWQGRQFEIDGTPYIAVSDVPAQPGRFGGGTYAGDQAAFDRMQQVRVPAPNHPGKWLIPASESGLLKQISYHNPDDMFRDRFLPIASLMVGGALAAGGAGAGTVGAAEAGSAAGGLAAADTAGLATMAADAGLTGAAADAFVASGGIAGSTAAGGGGVMALEGFIDPFEFAAGESADAAIGEVASAEGLTTPVSDTIAVPETGPYNAGAGAFDAAGAGATTADMAASGLSPYAPEGGGIIDSILKWGKDNPVLASTAVTVGGGLIKGAFTPSPKEIAEAQANAAASADSKKLQNRQAANQLGGLNMNRLKPTGKRLPRPGLIQSRM